MGPAHAFTSAPRLRSHSPACFSCPQELKVCRRCHASYGPTFYRCYVRDDKGNRVRANRYFTGANVSLEGDYQAAYSLDDHPFINTHSGYYFGLDVLNFIHEAKATNKASVQRRGKQWRPHHAHACALLTGCPRPLRSVVGAYGPGNEIEPARAGM